MNYERFGYLKMKRFLATGMAVVLTVSMLAGCGSSTDEKSLSSIDLEKYVTSIGEYKGMELTGTKLEITDEYLESYIDYMLENSKEPHPVEGRAVQDGDVVNIDYEGKKDGVAFEGGTAQGQDLEIGSGKFIEGFEEGLIGANVGDTVDLNLTFPDPYHNEELAGAAVVFTVTVNSISELIRPELTDEYVKSLGMEDCQNVEQFYDVVRQSLEDSATANYENELKTQITDQLMEICEFSEEVPEGLFQYYKEQIQTNFSNIAATAGMEVTDYVLQYFGMTEDQYETEVENGAANSARQAMACALIAKKEGITVTDEELKEKAEENYANFGYETLEDYMKEGNPEDYRDYLLTTRVLDFLMENAVVTEEPIEEKVDEAETTTEESTEETMETESAVSNTTEEEISTETAE